MTNKPQPSIVPFENIVIDEKDLPRIISVSDGDLGLADSSILTITFADLIKYQEEIISIGDRDLTLAERNIVRITLRDLPQILKIEPRDLPADLNCLTTEVYHGTSREAAERIQKEGFKVGSGNALGSGIYFSVGSISIAQGYIRGNPCIVRALVDWGHVAYLDDPKVITELGHGSGDRRTEVAIKKGYQSLIQNQKFSKTVPTVGVVLGMYGTYLRPPRIRVEELIDPRDHLSSF
jgi:hypothetical protein